MKGIALCIFLTATAFARPGVDLSLSTNELQRYFGVNSHEKAPEYEIVYPEVLNADYSKRNVGRSAIAASSLELQIDAFGQTLELALEHDDSSIRPGLVAEYIGEEGTITVPVRTDCLYTGNVRGQSTSLASVSACGGLIAVINHAEGPTYIEPLDEEHAIKRDIGRGLPHIAYKRMPDTGASCPVTSADFSYDDKDVDDEINETKSTKYLELGIISDYLVYSSRGTNTHICLTALFNAVKNVLQLNSLDAENTMEPKLVKLTIFTSYQADLQTGTSSEDSLAAAADWQDINNPPSYSAEHWDNAAIITGYELDSGATLGVAYVGQCGNSASASLTTFRTLSATDTLSHEIGHNLGMNHDSDGNGCSSSGYVMGAYATDYRAEPSWSICSKYYYDQFVGSHSCYNDA